MNQPQKNPSFEAMLQNTAKQMGTTPDALIQAAQSGDLGKLLDRQPGAKQLKQILSDPGEAQKLLNNPAVQKLIQQLNGKG